jgi:hypothetical protein
VQQQERRRRWVLSELLEQLQHSHTKDCGGPQARGIARIHAEFMSHFLWTAVPVQG